MIIGISAYYHDSAVCLISDGEILCALQEERFSRKKHDQRFPHHALRNLISMHNLSAEDINAVVFYDKPILKFERLIETYVSYVPKSLKQFRIAIPEWLSGKLYLKKTLTREFAAVGLEIASNKILFGEHHLSHIASAFYTSSFDDAVIICADGVGEWATTTIALGAETNVEIKEELRFPHSLGLLYSTFTAYLGFKVNSGEYKMMGLAPYGEPIYSDLIKSDLIEIKPDGSFKLNLDYFSFTYSDGMYNKKFEGLFGQKARKPSDVIDKFHMDIAASIQLVIEEAMLSIVEYATKKYQIRNVCLVGGVALNCVANGKIAKSKFVDEIWIPPAAGDAGGCLGAALSYEHLELKTPRFYREAQSHYNPYLGSEYDDEHVESLLTTIGATFVKYRDNDLVEFVAKEIASGNAVGWFQGKMEFGPRALGNRSILGNPCKAETQKTLNLKVKYRESFRPFAPSVLEEDCADWFDIDGTSPYMLLVGKVLEKHRADNWGELYEKRHDLNQINQMRSVVPAITHVDFSARIQSVNKLQNKKYHSLIKRFKDISGVGMLVNTSFNIRGEPIVESPLDAYRCFMGTNLDMLVVNNYVLRKKDQEQSLKIDYRGSFELD